MAIIDYLKESLHLEPKEISKTVRYHHPNESKTKTFKKFSASDTVVYDRYNGEPHQKRSGEKAAYFRCREKGNGYKLYVWNPSKESYTSDTCTIEPKSKIVESWTYCKEHNYPTVKTVVEFLFSNGKTYIGEGASPSKENLKSLRTSFVNECNKLFRGIKFQIVMNNDIENFLRYNYSYGTTLEELNEKRIIREEVCENINKLST